MTDPMLSTLVALIAIVSAVWMGQQSWRPTPLLASGDWAARLGFGGKRHQEPAENDRRPDSDILDEVAGGHYGGGRTVPSAHGAPVDEADPFDQIFGASEAESAPSIWSMLVAPQSTPPDPEADSSADSSALPIVADDVILPPPPPPPPAPQLSMSQETSYRSDFLTEPASSNDAEAVPRPSDMGLLEAIANMSTSDNAPEDSSDMGSFDDWASPTHHGTPSVPELPLTAPPAIPFGDLAPADSPSTSDWASAPSVDAPRTADWAESEPVEARAPITPDAPAASAVEVDADSWHSWQWANLDTDTDALADTPIASDDEEWAFEVDQPAGTEAPASEIFEHAPDNAAVFDLPEVVTAFGDVPAYTMLPGHTDLPVRDASALQSAASDFFDVLDPAPSTTSAADQTDAVDTPVADYPVNEMWLPDTTDDADDERWDEPVPEWDHNAWPGSASQPSMLEAGSITNADAGFATAADAEAEYAEADTDLYSLFSSDDDDDDDDDTDDLEDYAADYGDQVELVDDIESVRIIQPDHRTDPDETRVPVAAAVPGGDRWASSLLDRLRAVVEAPAEAPDALAEFEERFERGLSFRLTDDQVIDYLGRGLNMIIPDAEAQILRADDLDELTEVDRASQHTRPGCAVSRGDLCPAIVQHRTLQFDNSEHLDVCPHMANRGAGPFSATCIPLRGSDETESGVLHITTLINGRLHDDTVAAIEKAAFQSTDRLSQLRAHVRH